jgi:hypothetical protein
MADKALLGIFGGRSSLLQSRRDEQLMRRNLRIAVRQAERAELYLHALESLDLADDVVTERVADLQQSLRALQTYLIRKRNN